MYVHRELRMGRHHIYLFTTVSTPRRDPQTCNIDLRNRGRNDSGCHLSTYLLKYSCHAAWPVHYSATTAMTWDRLLCAFDKRLKYSCITILSVRCWNVAQLPSVFASVSCIDIQSSAGTRHRPSTNRPMTAILSASFFWCRPDIRLAFVSGGATALPDHWPLSHNSRPIYYSLAHRMARSSSTLDLARGMPSVDGVDAII